MTDNQKYPIGSLVTYVREGNTYSGKVVQFQKELHYYGVTADDGKYHWILPRSIITCTNDIIDELSTL